MTNFNFIESANESIKNVGANLRNGNKLYTSLSSVLKDIQRKAYLDAGYRAVFEALGLEAGKVTPKDFFGITDGEQWGKTVSKKGEEPWLGIWGRSTCKDADGNTIYLADGKTPKTEPKLRKVTSWTPNKLFKVIAQANAIAASKAEKKAA